MKTTTVKFTRNPKFTPASLSANELTRVERLAVLFFSRRYSQGESHWVESGDIELMIGFAEKFQSPERLTRGGNMRQTMREILKNADAIHYYKNCLLYMTAIWKKNGWICEQSTRNMRNKYAAASGYFR